MKSSIWHLRLHIASHRRKNEKFTEAPRLTADQAVTKLSPGQRSGTWSRGLFLLSLLWVPGQTQSSKKKKLSTTSTDRSQRSWRLEMQAALERGLGTLEVSCPCDSCYQRCLSHGWMCPTTVAVPFSTPQPEQAAPQESVKQAFSLSWDYTPTQSNQT